MPLEKYTGMEVELRKNKVDEAERLLGVRLDMERYDTTEYLFRLDQTEKLAGIKKLHPLTNMMQRLFIGIDGSHLLDTASP